MVQSLKAKLFAIGEQNTGILNFTFEIKKIIGIIFFLNMNKAEFSFEIYKYLKVWSFNVWMRLCFK